jgi:predicted nuclease with TOPRIM domain
MGILIKLIVDIIMGPFLWLSARKLNKNPEWIENQKKIKELEKKAAALNNQADKSYEQYQQMLAKKKLLREDIEIQKRFSLHKKIKHQLENQNLP